jgi:prepilin-type processing-associated H-X9-DG protein
MEVLVAVAIVLVLGALIFSTVRALKQRAHKQVAAEKMKKLGGALTNYLNQNNGVFPIEDADGQDTWANAAKPEAKDVWYNALPRLIGGKGVGDYAASPSSFYKDDNILYLPGADYPEKRKTVKPEFAIALNSKLQHNDPSGKKERPKLDQVTQPAKTVALLEQGCSGEKRTLEVQKKNDYDGSPKGNAKSFVGRYGGKGHLVYVDGHVELEEVKNLLTETGAFPFPQGDVVWTRTPEENPNQDTAQADGGKKKKKDETNKEEPK